MFMADKDFGQLLKEHTLKLPGVNDTVKGIVIGVESGAVRIDIDGIASGVVRGPELFAESTTYSNVKIGDQVEATVIEQENELGEMELSFRIAGHKLVWDKMIQHMKDGITIVGKVVQANKGGLMMKVDAVMGFLPVSQLSPENYPRVPGGDKNKIFERLQRLIGKEFQVKILDADPKEGKLIVSEKEVWEDEQKAVLDSYKIGDTVEGEVSALTSFGAFMRFGQGLEGLIHISEIAWQRIDHPKDVLKIGDRVRAQIIDLNKSKIYLSIKRLVDDPWKAVKDKYKINQKVEGEVHKVEAFGLMVKLDSDIHGLAHISELSDKPLAEKDMRDKFTIGSRHEFDIVNIEPSEHRLGLRLHGVKGRAGRGEEKPETKTSESTEVVETEEKKDEAAA